MADLVITLSNGYSFKHQLGAGPQVLGRDPTCHIAVDDPSTSRRHARFTPTSDGIVVEDLGSKNGTLVNGKPCTTQLLRNGDQILFGSVHAVYNDGSGTYGSVVIADEPASTHSTRYVTASRELVLPQKRLRVLYELGERLTTLRTREQLLDDALSVCFEMLHFERGAVGVKKLNTRGVEWPVVRHLRGAEGELTISRTILRRALEYGERVIFTASDSAALDPTVSIVQQGIRSAMCVPLTHEDRILGVIYGDRVSTSTVYSDEDIDFFAGIARQVSIGLVNAQLMDERAQMVRINRDLDVARTIQKGLFPMRLPQRENVQVAARNDPGNRVSGDYYDVIEAGDGRLWLLVADVTGEGISAAMLMANLQAAVRVSIGGCDDPAELLARWNQHICANTTPSKFITCLLALADPARRELRVASAGHHPPLVLASPKRLLELTVEPGFPLGIDDAAQYQSLHVPCGDGPFLYFSYTDGVVEAMNPQRAIFGAERLREIIEGCTDLDPRAAVSQVREAVTDFVGEAPQSDDITMLAARVG